jgi:hypothetical protein
MITPNLQYAFPTIDPKKFTQKIKLTSKDVEINFLLSRDIGSEYKVDYLVDIVPNRNITDPTKIVASSKIDLVSLRNAILAKLKPLDIKYMVLKSFDSFKCTFYFDVDKWIKDCMLNNNPIVELSKFSKKFKLKVMVPPMLLSDRIRIGLPIFIVARFKKHIALNRKSPIWFKHLFPQGITQAIGKLLPERFDYKYDFKDNSITLSLKPMWVAALLYAAGSVMKKLREEKIEDPERFFFNKVRENLNETMEDARKYATEKHAGQKRMSGEDYIVHPERVAELVKKYKTSHKIEDLVSAAYLHDTIEDTGATEEDLKKLFNPLIASLVAELTSNKADIRKEGKANYLSKKMLGMSSWGLVIKLADRLDNVSDLKTSKIPGFKEKYSKETSFILDKLEAERQLSNTQKKLTAAIREKLDELKN